MLTFVYVDAFNLYYRCLKGTPYRWLDLGKLCGLLLRGNRIGGIRYFTAVVDSRADDPGKQQRQQTYLRALANTPGLEIQTGHFITGRARMPNAHPPPATVEVIKTEEKGSDVNLATQLLIDGFKGRFQTAVVLSNDSDLVSPIRAVQIELGLPVGVLVPGTEKQIRRSALPADYYRRIRPHVLAASQFPDRIHDAHGAFRKPMGW